jgi:hypothetical protein
MQHADFAWKLGQITSLARYKRAAATSSREWARCGQGLVMETIRAGRGRAR